MTDDSVKTTTREGTPVQGSVTEVMHTIWRRFAVPAELRLLRDAHRHRVVGAPRRPSGPGPAGDYFTMNVFTVLAMNSSFMYRGSDA